MQYFWHLTLLAEVFLVHQVVSYRPTETTTITIPWTGTSTTSTTIIPCTGLATVVVEEPLQTPECQPGPPTKEPVPCLVKPSCQADGFNIDYYHNPMGGYTSGNIPSSYYITEELEPLKSSLTNITFFPQDSLDRGIYPEVYPPPGGEAFRYFVGWTRETNGGIVVDANNFTLVYYGFYRAPKTGTFTICNSADNGNEVYFGGGNAFSCCDGVVSAGAKPLISSAGGNFVNPESCEEVYLDEGHYYPIRSVMGNWAGASAFDLVIWEPEVPYEDRTHDFTDKAHPFECGWFT
ncbi:hypothetical protein MGN70_005066 [Eutypa lata]|nr:hypothetical protein MGN70_005066 [Eutypa lata]